MKKIITILLILVVQLSAVCITACANEAADLIQPDVYIQLGRYNDEPIVWKCVDIEDENGKLILSDKILCYKAFDTVYSTTNYPREYTSGTWENSLLRYWLNSTENAGEVNWPHPNPPSEENVRREPYADEAGFLNANNFTESEKSLMKTASYWQIMDSSEKKKPENGIYCWFGYNIETNGMGFPPYWKHVSYRYVSEFSHVEGAMYRLKDTAFLLDQKQLYNVNDRYGSVKAEPTEKVRRSIIEKYEGTYNYGLDSYWLRFGRSYVADFVMGDGSQPSDVSYVRLTGVRPAFYLNDNNVNIISGSGTEADPYIVDGTEQNNAVVFCNGSEVIFDQQPIEENDRLLVPVRAIFESLGAEVTYDDGDGVITANNGERTVVMQIDNHEMGNGTEVFTLDVAPKLVGDRTMVPLRAVSEAFDCKVEYIENLNRVVIDKPKLPMDFGEGIGKENWQDPEYVKHMKEKFDIDLDPTNPELLDYGFYVSSFH